MDISEIWDNLGYLAAPLAALLIFLLARRIPRKWLRIFVRTTAIVLLLISGLTLVVALLDFARSVRIAAIVSPDGKHVAVARWTGGLFDENYSAEAHVSVRSRFSPIATEVFSNGVVARSLPDLLNDPEVHWLDRNRLLISNGTGGQIKSCSPGTNRVEGIEVLCKE